MALPYLNLYIGDIMKDTDVLSPAAFGGYMRLLFKLHAAIPRGEVCFTTRQLCRVFAAATVEETLELLTEITDPAHNICDYTKKGDKHFFLNRRMKKEASKSEVRSQAGKLGAQKTNAKNRQNAQFAADYAAANSTANLASNDISENHQNYSNGNGSNNGNDSNSNGAIVPEMLFIWKQHKPNYPFQQDKDYPALRKIAELIAEQEKINFSGADGIERIKLIWTSIVLFIVSDNFLKDYQISQVEKYFQNISSKFVSSHETGSMNNNNRSTIQNNAEAAQKARNILNSKYADKT